MAMGGNQANTTMFNDTNQITIHGGQFTQNAQNTYVGQSGQGFWALSREVAPSAFYNAGHDFDLPKCHPNTRVAVLKRIKDWTVDRTDSEASLMWIYGAAGSGKSSIARSIAEWCQEEKILLASFFFFRSDPLRNNLKRFIATLTYHITQSVPDCRPIIEQAVESDPHIFSRSLDSQILHLILNPLSQVEQGPAGQPLPHVIIVDGLDECIETQEQTSVMQLFSTILSQHPYLRWKVLIASRPEFAIRYSFNDVTRINPSTGLALSDEYMAYEDIRCYLEDNFREIKHKNPNKSHLPCDWPSKEDIDSLVWKSSGQFIYAATVIKFLSSGKRVRARLRTILDVDSTTINDQAELPFRQLDVLYEQILSSAGAGQVEAVKQTTALCILYEICLFRFVCVVTFQTPGEVIAAILGLEIEDVDCILEELSSILEVSRHDVRLYHASIGDFLFDPNRAGNMWVDERIFWTKIVCYFLQSLPTVPKGPYRQEHWIATLTTALRRTRPTEEVTQCLSFDFTPLFGIYSDNQLFKTWIEFFDLLRERSLEIDDWKSLYHEHISTYDHWLASLLQNRFSVSYAHRAQVAFLSFRSIPYIAVIAPLSKSGPNSSSYFYTRYSPLPGAWGDMFETNQLPKVKAYLLNGQIQASAVIHCIHFFVECAVTGRLVRFRRGPDRRKSRPWFWRRRLLTSRHSPQHLRFPKKTWHHRHHHSSHPPFIPFCSPLKTLDRIMTTSNKYWLMDSTLRVLLHLLDRATISSHLVFALRVALSLTCTSRKTVNLWREAKKAMTKYLDVAGLKPKMLGFVAPHNIWRDRPWDRLKDYGDFYYRK